MNFTALRKIVTLGSIALLMAVGILAITRSGIAEAGFLQDLWNRYIAPQSTNSVRQAQAVDLYQPALDYERAVVAAVKKADPAVVSITISKNVPIIEDCVQNLPPEFQNLFGENFQIMGQCQRGTALQEVGGGSGFIISSDGLIVTNKHVVVDTRAAYTVFTNDGKKYDAQILARDPVQDLAILKINANGLPTVELSDSDSLELGQTAVAIGNALGEFRNTVSVGVISGLARTVTATGAGIGAETIQGVIQTDAAINPGNSGGPLLNLEGKVIGINTAVVSDAQNIGFAIPINRAKRDIQSVKASGEIQVPYMGVRYITVTPDFAQSEKLQVDYGALIRGDASGPAIALNSPAAKAGLQAEDIILEVNGKKIDKDNLLGSMINNLNVGDTVSMKILRGGKEMTVSVTLAKRPA